MAGVWVVVWGGALASLISIATTSAEAFAFTRRELVRDWNDIKERFFLISAERKLAHPVARAVSEHAKKMMF